MRALLTRVRPRAATAADQAASSLSNFGLQVFVSRSGDLTSIAVFAVVYATYWLLLGSVRGLLLDPMLVMSYREPERRSALWRSATTLALLGTVAAGAVVAVVALLVPGAYRPALLTLAVGLPVLVAVDCLRYVHFADARPDRALRVDSWWLGAQVVLFGALVLTDGSPEEYFAAWLLGALLAVATGGRTLLGSLTRLRAAVREWRHLRGVGLPGLGEFLLNSGTQQLLPLGLVVIVGTASAALLRTAQTMVSPVNTIFSATTLMVLPIAAAAASSGDRERYLRAGRTLGAVLFAVGALVALGYAVVPTGLLVFAFGDVAQSTRPLAVVLGLQVAVVGWGIAMATLLRVALAARTVLVVAAVTSPLYVVAPLVAAALVGPIGVTWGLLSASTLAAVLLSAAVSRRDRRTPATPEEDPA